MKMLIFSAMLFIAASSFTTVTIETKPAKHIATGCFNYFRVHRQAKDVDLSWAVSSPGITQFVVERSYDGQYFDPINAVPGAMGASKYRDQNVFPGYIYYRVTAVKSDGSTESSSVEVVRIVQR